MNKMQEFWDKIREKTGDTRTWDELTRTEQNALMQAVNIIMAVCNGAFKDTQ